MRDSLQVFGVNMAPRANRRWLVAVVYTIFLAAWVFLVLNPLLSGLPLLLLATVVNGLVLGGYGRAGLIKPFGTQQFLCKWGPVNDERELHRRDRMHFYAYRWVVILMVLGYFMTVRPFDHGQVGRALLLLGLVLGLTLPQALLLWTEPDVEHADAA